MFCYCPNADLIVITSSSTKIFVLQSRQRRYLFGLRIKLSPVVHSSVEASHFPLNAKRQAGKLLIPISIVLGLTRPGIKPWFTESNTGLPANAIYTRILIGYFDATCIICSGERICGFGRAATSTAAPITSPGWPNPYPVSINCEWTLQARNRYKLRLDFTVFSTEETYDFLSVS